MLCVVQKKKVFAARKAGNKLEVFLGVNLERVDSDFRYVSSSTLYVTQTENSLTKLENPA